MFKFIKHRISRYLNHMRRMSYEKEELHAIIEDLLVIIHNNSRQIMDFKQFINNARTVKGSLLDENIFRMYVSREHLYNNWIHIEHNDLSKSYDICNYSIRDIVNKLELNNEERILEFIHNRLPYIKDKVYCKANQKYIKKF